ncbi:MAG: GNAT family N-acetyltransferase [Nanoarchaeota archaeon]|nr:GNAT family N-acetyltransferase [Nanoarchaeota archaeon]
MVIYFTFREIKNEDKIGIGETYCEVFKSSPWFEYDWTLTAAISELESSQTQEGFLGVLAETKEKIIGFSWGYKLPAEMTDGKNFLEMRRLLIDSGINPDRTFYGSETGVLEELQGKGIGSGLLELRTRLMDKKYEAILFRTKNDIMVQVYENVFGTGSVKILAKDPTYQDRNLYLLRVGKLSNSLIQNLFKRNWQGI